MVPHRVPTIAPARCVGVEAAARDGEHALTIVIDVDGPSDLQEHNGADDE